MRSWFLQDCLNICLLGLYVCVVRVSRNNISLSTIFPFNNCYLIGWIANSTKLVSCLDSIECISGPYVGCGNICFFRAKIFVERKQQFPWHALWQKIEWRYEDVMETASDQEIPFLVLPYLLNWEKELICNYLTEQTCSLKIATLILTTSNLQDMMTIFWFLSSDKTNHYNLRLTFQKIWSMVLFIWEVFLRSKMEITNVVN